MSDKISDKDKKDWQNFLSSKDKLPNKDFKVTEKKIENKSLDLHGSSLDKANILVERFVRDAFKQKISKIKIITGKGLHSQNDIDPYVSKKLGILKYSVPEYIKNNNELMKLINNIEDADIDDGGTGAFYIYLKKN